MDGAGHNKECADNNNEARVFARGMLNAGGTVEAEDVIAARGPGQECTQFLVMPFPMLPQNQRENCDGEEKNGERREQCGMRFDHGGAHCCCLRPNCRLIRFWVKQKRAPLISAEQSTRSFLAKCVR